jgi:hypothetical protein
MSEPRAFRDKLEAENVAKKNASKPKTEADFEADLVAELEAMQASEPGTYQAIDWKKVLDKVKEVVVIVGPVIGTFAGPQYDAIVKVIALIVGGKSDAEPEPAV